MKLGNAKIERFREQHCFAGWLATSAKTGENCSDKESGGQPSKLKQLIAASIPWDKLPWTSTPRLLAELKNAVVAMRDERDIRLLRFAELTQRLEQVLCIISSLLLSHHNMYSMHSYHMHTVHTYINCVRIIPCHTQYVS